MTFIAGKKYTMAITGASNCLDGHFLRNNLFSTEERNLFGFKTTWRVNYGNFHFGMNCPFNVKTTQNKEKITRCS